MHWILVLDVNWFLLQFQKAFYNHCQTMTLLFCTVKMILYKSDNFPDIFFTFFFIHVICLYVALITFLFITLFCIILFLLGFCSIYYVLVTILYYLSQKCFCKLNMVLIYIFMMMAWLLL